jgi:hypothetical protein
VTGAGTISCSAPEIAAHTHRARRGVPQLGVHRFAIGAADRVFFRLHISYIGMIHFWRIGVWLVPFIVFFLTRSICRTLQRRDAHPLRTWQGAIVRRRADGSVGGAGGESERRRGATDGAADRDRARAPGPINRLAR